MDWRCRNNTTGYAARQQESVFTQFHKIFRYGVSNAADHHKNTNKPLNSTAAKMKQRHQLWQRWLILL